MVSWYISTFDLKLPCLVTRVFLPRVIKKNSRNYFCLLDEIQGDPGVPDPPSAENRVMYVPIYNHVQSLSPTLLWVRKCDVKLESLNFIFKTLMGKCVFEKSY